MEHGYQRCQARCSRMTSSSETWNLAHRGRSQRISSAVRLRRSLQKKRYQISYANLYQVCAKFMAELVAGTHSQADQQNTRNHLIRPVQALVATPPRWPCFAPPSGLIMLRPLHVRFF